MKHLLLIALFLAGGCSTINLFAADKPLGNAAAAAGEPVLELPTLQCLGAYWFIRGDENRNARVEVEYRKVGQTAWLHGQDLFRVYRGQTSQKTRVPELETPTDGWLFAGSIVQLPSNTEYEIRLTLRDPDGGYAQRVLRSRTIEEPQVPDEAAEFHVAPGNGGGDGTAENPYRGLDQAQKSARPGDVMLLHKGVYDGPFVVSASGRVGKPIVYRGAGDGEAVIDGKGKAQRGIEARGISDVWFEDISIRAAETGVLASDSSRMIIRRCHIYNVKCGIYVYGYKNDAQPAQNFLIADNVLEGPFQWDRDSRGAAMEEFRGIQIVGSGHIVCHNRVTRFKDGIDTCGSKYCSAIDIYNNDISDCMDDGIEMDFSERNNRCWNNRLTNVFQGISEQPIYGGPVYIFRNVLYNIKVEPFKLHHVGLPGGGSHAPSGAIFYHNTVVKKGMPLLVWSGAPVYNCVSRNNLFIGSQGNWAYENIADMVDCDYDYDGFGGAWKSFLKWNKQEYRTLADAQAKAPVYRHARLVAVPTVFASGLLPPEDVQTAVDPAKVDLRLKAGTAAIDAGCVLPGFNDGFSGKAPDLGAYELGGKLPQYGLRKTAP